MALECGSSDATSGIAANPVVGVLSDRIVEAGGTVVLSEAAELLGAEHILARRAVSPEVGQRILDMVGNVEVIARQMGVDIRGSQPTPGNILGGISTIEEKSLGCVFKAGTSPVQGVLDFGERPLRQGSLCHGHARAGRRVHDRHGGGRRPDRRVHHRARDASGQPPGAGPQGHRQCPHRQTDGGSHRLFRGGPDYR